MRTNKGQSTIQIIYSLHSNSKIFNFLHSSFEKILRSLMSGNKICKSWVIGWQLFILSGLSFGCSFYYPYNFPYVWQFFSTKVWSEIFCWNVRKTKFCIVFFPFYTPNFLLIFSWEMYLFFFSLHETRILVFWKANLYYLGISVVNIRAP